MEQLSFLKQAVCRLLWSTVIGCTIAACSNQDFPEVSDGPTIGFSTSIVREAPPMVGTRGTPIALASSLTDMGVFCYYTGFDTWATAGATTTPDKMNNMKWTQAALEWSTESPVNWGTEVSIAEKFSFFGYAPYATGGLGNGITVNEVLVGTPTLTYTVPTDITKQPDLMIATAKDVHPTGSKVPLTYKHALTCIAFKVGGSGEYVTDIKVTGVSVSGTLSLDASGEPVWSNLASPTTSEYSAGVMNGGIVAGTTPTDALNANGYLMMIPQTLQPGAKLIVTVDGNPLEFDLSGQTTTTWRAGQQLTYNISIIPDVPKVITVSPEVLLVGTPGTDSRYSKLEVTCDPLDAEWTLHSNGASLTLSLNSDGTGASSSVSGVGPKTVYAVMGPNLTATKQEVRLSIDDNDPDEEIACLVRQASYKASDNVPELNAYKYIGAFWKKNETQERIIRIPSPLSEMYNGPWVASVVWADENWNAGDIVIENSSSFPGNPYNEGINTAPSGSWISATTTESVSGNVTYRSDGVFTAYTANNFIYFRIGLKSTYTPTPTAPARYAIIALGYRNGYTALQQILIRQGEDADYVMGSGAGYCKFSPYNLSTFTNFMGKSYVDIPQNGAWWTSYPTNSGIFFQYANVNYPRRAYSPTTLSDTGWSSQTTGSFTATEEVCPSGYRRFTAIRDAASDIYTNLNKNYYAAGYYADGFFDRQIIGNGVNHTGAIQSKYSTVFLDRENLEPLISYTGAVYYNPETAASVFFPFCGIRNSGTTTAYAGQYGFYWASNRLGSTTFTTFFTELPYQINGLTPSSACPIRCVKD